MADSTTNLRLEKAEFDGILIAVLSYGALVMLFLQLLRVLLTRPKRGKVFWGICVYSGVLFTLASIAAGGKMKFAEYTYVSSRFENDTNPSDTPSQIAREHSSMMINVMSQVCTTLIPWVGDILMLYRVMVVWNYRWWLLTLPIPVYLARIAMSIPLLIIDTDTNPNAATKTRLYGNIFYGLCVALNIMVSFLITLRLVTMRKKLEVALGRLHASFYTSVFTILVESGAFFTLWGIVYVAARSQDHWSQDVFLQPYSYIISITRMLIVLRMAQNRAWSKDIVTAASTGIMDWQVSSTHSIPLHDAPPPPSTKLKVKSTGSSSASTHTLG